MGRPPSEPASPSALAPALLRYLAGRGADHANLALRVGVACSAADADEVPITSAALAMMFDGASDLLGEPHLALALARELPFLRYDAVALALRAAPTAADVFAIVARYAPLVFPALDARVVEDGDEVRLHARVRGHPRGLGLRVDEYLLALVLMHAGRGGAAAPHRAWLASARPRDLGPLFLAFGTRDVAFGAEDTGLAMSRAHAHRPLPGGDPLLLATADGLASAALAAAPRQGALSETVARKIEAALPEESRAESLAESLHISPRTLQRRLEEEGTRLSEVVDAVREKIARRCLGDRRLGLAEIAHRAGFSDVATFSRAFKRWTGMPPGAFRRRG